MINNAYFENVIEIGNLYLEHIFYEFESEPILFTCADEKKKLYLCLCSDIRYGQRWIIAECSISTLKAVIEEKIDIASAFLKVPSVIVIDMDLKGIENSHIIESDKIDRLDLPKEGTYIRCDKEKAKNYLLHKACEDLCEPLKLRIDIMPAMPYKSVTNKIDFCINTNTHGMIFAEYMDKLAGAVKPTISVSAGYSVNVKENYNKTTESVDAVSSDNDSYLQAA